MLISHSVGSNIYNLQVSVMFVKYGNARFVSAVKPSMAANSPTVHSEFLLCELPARQVPSTHCRVTSIHVKVCRGFEAAK